MLALFHHVRNTMWITIWNEQHMKDMPTCFLLYKMVVQLVRPLKVRERQLTNSTYKVDAQIGRPIKFSGLHRVVLEPESKDRKSAQ
jgi:hypothetical protein